MPGWLELGLSGVRLSDRAMLCRASRFDGGLRSTWAGLSPLSGGSSALSISSLLRDQQASLSLFSRDWQEGVETSTFSQGLGSGWAHYYNLPRPKTFINIWLVTESRGGK